MTGTKPSQAAPAAADLRLRLVSAAHAASYRLRSGAAVTATYSLRSTPEHHFLRRSDSAVRAMTDFAASPAFTISADCAVDDTLDEMFRRGVRALVVLADDGVVVGLVSSYDIQGERTDHYLADHPSTRREEVRVRDILTPCGECSIVDWQRIQCASVADVLEVFRSTDSPYLIVLEARNEATAGILRGIISRSWLERRLGESP